MRIPSGHYDRECLLAVTGRVPLELVHDAGLVQQASATAPAAMRWPGAPRVSLRSLPTHPRLSAWRRLVLVITRLRASF